MSRTTLPVCPKTGSTSPSLTVHLCLHTALLREIGNAPLVAALRSRPPTSPPDVIFVTARPPYRQLSGSTVSDIAKRALRRAGVTVPRPGAHVFRHAFASQMVRRDVPMKTVADLLGHARLETTTIYAKLDRETLATVALPWPGGAR